EQGAVEVEQRDPGVVIGETVVLGQVADAPADRRSPGRLVEDGRLPVGGADNAEQDLDERRLAGAVLPQQAEDFAALDRERDALEGADPAVLLGELIGDDDGHRATLLGTWWDDAGALAVSIASHRSVGVPEGHSSLEGIAFTEV